MARRIILWTAPRCLSNAFLCSVSTLPNTKHFHELFSGVYYFAPGSERFNFKGNLPEDELTYDGVKALLLADYPGVDLVFSKELALCLPESMYLEMSSGVKFAQFTHSFLIRDPERAFYSYYKGICSEGDQSILDLSDIGLFYSKLYEFYNFVKEKRGTNPVVIDAGDLQTHPDETMKCYCEAVGIKFDPKMMSWEPGHFDPRYKVWSSKIWHSTVLQSTKFIKIDPKEQKPVPMKDFPREIQKCIEDSRFYYKELKKACLKPT